MNRPQIMVVILIIQSLMIAVFTAFLRRVWFAYILFLVFLGGILVIFIYIRRLASWVKVIIQYKNFLLVSRIALLMFLSDGIFLWIMGDINYCFMGEDKIIYLLTSKTIYLLYLFVVGYLLLALYIICMMVKISDRPLRKFSLVNS